MCGDGLPPSARVLVAIQIHGARPAALALAGGKLVDGAAVCAPALLQTPEGWVFRTFSGLQAGKCLSRTIRAGQGEGLSADVQKRP